MSMPDRVSLFFEPKNSAVRIDSLAEGIHSSKLISLESLTDCFLRSTKDPMIHSGLLPPGCLSYSEGDGGWLQATLLFPERRCEFTYHKTVYSNFPLPRLAFRFSLYRGKRVQQVCVGVVDEGRLTPQTKMFYYPFSNVNGYRMCTGVNALPRYDSLHGLSTLPYLILFMPNNDDYYNPKNNRKELEYRGLLEHLRDKDPAYFYSDLLIPNGDTLEKFLTLP